MASSSRACSQVDVGQLEPAQLDTRWRGDLDAVGLVLLGARLYERSLLRTGSAVTWRSALKRSA